MADLRCVVVTPEKTEVDVKATSIIVPLFDGEMGILPGRAPMIGRLGFGILKVKTDKSSTEHYVDGGFVQVTPDGVYILTDRVLPPSALDAKQAEKDLNDALSLKALTPETYAIKERALTQARAKVRLAGVK